jgi:hypothetical protein
VARSEVTQQPGAIAFLSQFNRIGMRALRGYASGGLVLPSASASRVKAAEPSTYASTVQNRLQVVNLLDADALVAHMASSRNFDKTIVNSVLNNGRAVKSGIDQA